ncbi:MAG: pilin [Patescibacteria group bacterium]|nr:pilin [Patescibacteria group bacterium]
MTILPNGEPETWTLGNLFGSSNSLFNNVLNIALALASGIAIIYLIIGAYGYFTAFGNEERANKAKTTITWAIVGIIVIILARIAVDEVIKLLTSATIPVQ